MPLFPYATRRAADAAGTLQSEVSLIEGTAYQSTYNRWGDYSSMNVDPSDDCTFWYTNEYIQNTSPGWQTRIGSFRVQGCGQGAYLPFVIPLLLPGEE